MAKAFSLNPNPTFKVAVTFPIAGSKDATINVDYHHKTTDEINDYIQRNKEMKDIDAAMEIMAGWDISEQFNRENVERLFQNYGGSGRAVLQTYLRELWGAREGN